MKQAQKFSLKDIELKLTKYLKCLSEKTEVLQENTFYFNVFSALQLSDISSIEDNMQI